MARKARRRVRPWHVGLALLTLLLAAGSWWYRSGSPRVTLPAGEGTHAVAFSPDGTLLATGGSGPYHPDRGEVDGGIRLWDVGNGREVANWVAHSGSVRYLAFDPGGRTLTSAAVIRSSSPLRWELKVWDLASRREVGGSTTTAGPGDFPVISPTGRVVAKHGGSGILVVCDRQTGDELYRVEADRRQLNCVAFSPDGSLLATGGGDTSGGGPSPIPWMNGGVRLWEVGTGRLLATYDRHSGPIEAVAFSPDGRWVASVSLDGTAKVWAVHRR